MISKKGVNAKIHSQLSHPSIRCRSCTILALRILLNRRLTNGLDLLLTDAHLDWSQILSRTKSAVWLFVSRSFWHLERVQWLVYLAVAFGLTPAALLDLTLLLRHFVNTTLTTPSI